jgi:hypothetical protein
MVTQKDRDDLACGRAEKIRGYRSSVLSPMAFRGEIADRVAARPASGEAVGSDQVPLRLAGTNDCNRQTQKKASSGGLDFGGLYLHFRQTFLLANL